MASPLVGTQTVPIRTPLYDNGRLTRPWILFFEQLYRQAAERDVAPIALDKSGTLAVATNVAALRVIHAGREASAVLAYVKTAPTGADLILSLKVGGTTWMTVTITAGTTSVSVATATVAAAAAIAADSLITLDITQVGATVAGADLSVLIFF